MRKLLLGWAALSALAVPASADDFDTAQVTNTGVMDDLIAALAVSDAARISAIDGRIDYAIDLRTNTTINPSQMVELFKGCIPTAIEAAQRFRDTTILNFECSGRELTSECSTGDLRIMVFRDPQLAVGVIERQEIGPDCRMLAPPPAPPRMGTPNG